ncbi:MAG: hypothetical protein MSA36_04655 [Treponema porcinum]|uniref:hypothetical protein n=1 Tax=Treponema porcinum TaxID=261392 RepID=UPI0023535125|nr:hypothetical protein [Treponema porcinum]MCI7534273.1 hypothetical protein [Treponema porcinum]
MKIMKKIAAVTIAAAALFAFAGCSDADDPNEMITGSNKKYEIDYTNTTEDTSRGYHTTAYKHAGAAVQLDFENVSKNANAGVMGLIFDLEEKDGVKSFNVIGVKTNNADGELGYYVSRFENVTDIQAENFGTKLKENPAKETVYAPKAGGTFGKANGIKSTEKDDTITVYAYAIEKKAEAVGTDSANKEYAAGEYIYEVYLINDTVANLDKDGNLVDDNKQKIELSSTKAVATIATGYTSLTQKKLAVYANVYGKKTLKGTWTYRGDYKEVGVDED